MSGHWQMKKPMYALEYQAGESEGNLRGPPHLYATRKEAIEAKKALVLSICRIVKVKVSYTEVKK